MSDTIQSAEDFAEELSPWIRGIGIRRGQHENGIKKNALLIKSRDAAHIALGREQQKAEDDKVIEAMAKTLEITIPYIPDYYISTIARCIKAIDQALALLNHG
jgi:hypothetical protein